MIAAGLDDDGVEVVVEVDEEGMDFPQGEDCPFCPFWEGKQGSNRKD